MKVCIKCAQKKQESEFHKNSRTNDGLHSYCKECRAKHPIDFMQSRGFLI